MLIGKYKVLSLCFCSIFTFTWHSALSQTQARGESDTFRYMGTPIPKETKVPYDDIDGSPYHYEEFIRGQIVLTTGDTVSEYIRYNAYMDEMEIIRNNHVIALERPSEVNRILLNDRVYCRRVYLDFYGLQSGYFIELVGGSSQLYKLETIEFFGAESPATSYHQGVPAKFKRGQDIYYYRRHGDVLKRFFNNKSVLIDLFQLEYNRFMTYLTENNLKLRKEEDMIHLFSYMNEALQNN